MAGVKEKPFKTAPYSLVYLAGDIHGFYNRPSPQYKIRGKNIISDHRLAKQRGYFNSNVVDIYPRGGRGFYRVLYSVPRVPKSHY